MLDLNENRQVTIEQLAITAQLISVEAMSTAQVLQALPHRLPAFVADVKAFVSNMLQAKDVHVLGAIDTRELERRIPKENYVALSDVTVFVPPSMNAEWMVFLDAVEQSQAVAEKLMPETLTPTLKWLAQVLTNPSALSSIRSRMGDTGIVFHDLEKTKRQISACYSKHGSDTKVRYGDVFNRNGDFLVSMKRVNDINERLSKINKQEVVDTVNEITAAMDKLLIRMKQYPEEYKTSGVTMNDLSKLALNLGYEIEFFAAHVYLVQTATQAMSDTKEKMDEMIKR